MSLRRVAIIFDKQLRPDTTGVYCERALRGLIAVEHVSPSDLERISPKDFDAFLFIDDSLAYRIPDGLRPRACWVIDTHLGYERCRERALGCDLVFAAQRNGAERLQQDGIDARWLPLACDPEVHRRYQVPLEFDWCFVGTVRAGRRPELLRHLQQRFPRGFIGQRYFDEMARTYSASKLVINQSVRDDVNMRVFEAAACGSLLLTNDLRDNGQAELLQDGVHCAVYHNEEELDEKLAYYLQHDAEREQIAAAGCREVLAKHTYRHRMQTILEALERNSPASSSVTVGWPLAETWLDELDFGIKTFLRPAALRRLLESIRQFYPEAQVTIADDGNLREGRDADSVACCQLIDAQPRFRLLPLPFAAGVSAGRNALVAATNRPFLLFLDDDFFFSDATRIDRLFHRLKTEPDLGGIAGNCMDHHHGQRVLRQSGGTLDIVGRTLHHETQAWRDAARGICDYIPLFALFRRAVLATVPWQGGLCGEHFDFLLRLQSSGIRVAKSVDVTIEHDRFVPALEGYEAHRSNYADAQQWLLERWNLDRVLQDGSVIMQRSPGHPVEKPQTAPGLAQEGAGKPAGYFDHPRPEVAALVPPTARRILDLGCGSGKLAESLKRRRDCEVWGVEMNPTAAQAAHARLDRVLVADLERLEGELPEGYFDCIIAADVLEHLRRPGDLLARCRRWLTPQGDLIASLPNVQHHSVITGLLDGNFNYEPSGLLDEDHVRFFTRREIGKLFFRAGLEIAEWKIVPGEGYETWRAAGHPGTVQVGGLQINGLTPQQAEAFYAYQYLVRGRPRAPTKPGLTSIILVTHNQLAYTIGCLDSVRFRTDEPYELIVVDNGSTDGSVDYLRAQSDVSLIVNPDNRGFPAAVNQGLRAARGQYFLLLNNDTLVTTGWLRRMLDCLHRHPQIGLVGPTSNAVSGPQQIEVRYQNLEGLDGFAWEWGQQNQGKHFDHDRLIGFCLLIRAEVVRAIGFLDERFGIGNFEDDDYCRRARQASFRTVVAVDSFIHHFGHRTFEAAGINLAQLMAENERKYREKWEPTGAAPAPSAAPFRAIEAPGGGLLLQSRRPRLSLCMIVRNNESTIRPCLESIRPWVDEMIVVDTGSTDRTPELCRERGAAVHHWAWREDFAAARNESLRYATGDWIFWMDSDDTIPPDCGPKLRALADAEHPPELLGFVMQVHCPASPADGPQDVTIVDHIKLFRNRPDLRFEHRIHEQILPAIRRAGGDVRFTEIFVVHSGSDQTAEGRARKLERDFRLLTLDLAERPEHPFVLFNLGMTHADCGQFAEAEQALRRCLAVSRTEESHVRKAYALLINVLYQQQRFPEADEVCQRAREIYPHDKELRFRQGMVEHQLGHLDAAILSYRTVIEAPTERHFASIDAGLTGYKARHNLAIVYEDRQQFEQAEQQWRAILKDYPEYPPALARFRAPATTSGTVSP